MRTTRETQARLERELVYPVFLIEDRKDHRYSGYVIVKNRLGYTVYGRVPNAQQYRRGLIFDSAGGVFTYEGAAGWPRFSPAICGILDNLLLPGLITKLFELIVYFGPNLTLMKRVDVATYRGEVLRAVSVYEKKQFKQLSELVSEAKDYSSIIKAVDWFRYYGGRRDPDGHPEEFEDGSKNQEYNP